MKEQPACAAINVNGLIVAGRRHDNCLRSMFEYGIPKGDYKQGFMTTAGRFVDRMEALKLFLDAGMVSANPEGLTCGGHFGLFSEDLYDGPAS